jgi:hypothetical protein
MTFRALRFNLTACTVEATQAEAKARPLVSQRSRVSQPRVVDPGEGSPRGFGGSTEETYIYVVSPVGYHS